MPNWVKNNVTIKRHDEESFNTSDVLTRLNHDPNTDLNADSITPEPPYGTFEDEVPGKEHFLSSQRYTWRIGNWGIKWNSNIIEAGYIVPDSEVDAIHVSFETPWSSPVKVLTDLSKLLGEDYILELQATDEFLGNHCDYNLTIDTGDVTENPIEGDYEEWWCGIWGYDPDEFKNETN